VHRCSSWPPARRRRVAPFSHAVEVDGWCFITGQMPTYPEDDGQPLAPDIEGQTTRGDGEPKDRAGRPSSSGWNM